MSKITVRALFAALLENNMQIDDEIDFVISPETKDLDNLEDAELNLVKVERYDVDKSPSTLEFIFDLDGYLECEE